MSLPHLLSVFDSRRLEARDLQYDRNLQDDRGVILDLTQFADQGGVSADFQGQWYESPVNAPSDTLLPGTIDLPSSATEKKCLEWNYTTDPKSCDDWESTSEMRERVAEQFFRQTAKFADGSWESIPWYEWAGAIR